MSEDLVEKCIFQFWNTDLLPLTYIGQLKNLLFSVTILIGIIWKNLAFASGLFDRTCTYVCELMFNTSKQL